MRLAIVLLIAAVLAHGAEGTEPPVKVVLPAYPLTAVGKGIEGSFTLEVKIGKAGEVLQVNILEQKYNIRPDDPSILLKPLRSALLQWRYPAGEERSRQLHAQFKLFAVTTDTSNDVAIFESPDKIVVQYHLMLNR
jgi:hypothetical protein